MSKPFWRIHIQNKQANYNFIGGGTTKEMIENVQKDDEVRADGIKIAQDIMRYLLTTNKPMDEKVFLTNKYDNGLEFWLYLCGEIEEADNETIK